MASVPGLINFQQFTSAGDLAASYRMYTYTQGTTTHKDTFTDAAGTIAHTYVSNGVGGKYIQLNARGELPAPLYLSAGAYDLALKTAAGATVWTRRADGLFADFAASLGSALVGFLQAGTGATARTAQAKMRDVVHVKDFGATGDGTTDDSAAIQLAVNYCKAGFTLDFGNGIYNLGTITTTKGHKITIDSPTGMSFIGNGALIKCGTSGTSGKCSAFAINNPLNFKSNGINFTDPTFTLSTQVSGSAYGCGLFLLYATAPSTAAAPCGNVQIDGVATDALYFVVIDASTNYGPSGNVGYAMRNVEVSGRCTRVYYAMTNIYGAVDTITRIECTDVRRGLLSYGLRQAKIKQSLVCTSGFQGSNAFINLACESTVFGDVFDVDIDLSVSGVEGALSYVVFYHQGSATTGVITDVRARISLNNLTTVGRYGGDSTVTNGYEFLHEIAGVAQVTTTRETSNLDIECTLTGTISGVVAKLASLPTVKKNISLGRYLTAQLTTFAMWDTWKVIKGSLTVAWTGTMLGASNGLATATYAQQTGYCAVVDGIASFTNVLEFTSANGTGNATILGLPIGASLSDYFPLVNVGITTLGAANQHVYGALTGASNKNITLYQMDLTSRAQTLMQCGAAGTISLGGSFNLYP